MSKIITKESIQLSLLLIFLSLLSLFSVKLNALIILLVIILVFSIYIIVKRKKVIDKKDIIIGVALMMICLPTNPILGVFVLPVYIASQCVLKNTKEEIPFFGSSSNLKKTLLCIVVGGGMLSVINLFLMKTTMNVNFNYTVQFFLTSLGIGIYEEVIFRMFYFALCLFILKDKKMDKTIVILSYLIMILPHVLLHPNIDFVSVLTLSLLFGLPFALMQRKINLVSAIGAHGVVDFIRFIILGI